MVDSEGFSQLLVEEDVADALALLNPCDEPWIGFDTPRQLIGFELPLFAPERERRGGRTQGVDLVERQEFLLAGRESSVHARCGRDVLGVFGELAQAFELGFRHDDDRFAGGCRGSDDCHACAS